MLASYAKPTAKKEHIHSPNMPVPSILRKRHEVEEITSVPGPLECDVSGIETLKHLHDYEKAHKFDPNFPIDEFSDLDAAIATGNGEKGIEIEHALMEDNSPYPEVCLFWPLYCEADVIVDSESSGSRCCAKL